MSLSFIQAGQLTGLILDGQVWCRQDYDFMSVNYFLSQRQHFIVFLPILWGLHYFDSLFCYAGVDVFALPMAEHSASTLIRQESLQLSAPYCKKLLWARVTVVPIYEDENKNLEASLTARQFVYLYILGFIYFYFTFISVWLHQCLCTTPMQYPWDWNYSWLWATM